MGVPAFFKWLCMRCPKILHDVLDDLPPEVLEEEEYLNRAELEIDNLYLDMNCIIHPCTHPEHLPIPKPMTEEDMFLNIFMYLDKLMKMVKPRKLVYFAVDGVAPRAKMNQQRGRRFKSAQEALKIIEKKERLKKEWQERGQDYPHEIEEHFSCKFDSNVITPGTEFMDRMSKAVEYYITERLNKDPLFRELKCIFSDANIPGEGEHKILDFIRQQRALDDYDPNLSHCIYGADADLIMLGLSTHEPYFYILRETVMTKKEMSGNKDQEAQPMEGEFHERAKKEIQINFQFIKLFAFREYLDFEFKFMNLPFEYNLENIIDDFVFMCFFVGNDFLPHLPCLSIREGGIDCLVYMYKRSLPVMGGNFIDNGNLNLMRIDMFLREIGQIEESLLQEAARQQAYRSGGRGRGRGRGGYRGRGGDNRNNGDYRRDGDDYNRNRDRDRNDSGDRGRYERSDSYNNGNRDYRNDRDRDRYREDRSRDDGGRDGRGSYRGDRDYNRDDRDYRGGRDNRRNEGDDRYNKYDRNRGDERDDRDDRGHNNGGHRNDRYERDNDRESNKERERDRDRDRDRSRNGNNRSRGGEGRGNREGDNDNSNSRNNRDNESEAERNRKNRNIADLFKSQLKDSLNDSSSEPAKNKVSDSSERVLSPKDPAAALRENSEKPAPKAAPAASLADWSRDDEDEEKKEDEEEKKEVKNEVVSTAMPIEPSEKPTEASPRRDAPIVAENQMVDETKQGMSRLSSTITDVPSEGKPKAEEVPLDPRIKFNKELQDIMKEDQQGDESMSEIPPGSYKYKQNYYFEKFKVMPHEFNEFRKLIQKSYCEALCWIYAYYYKGCVSWKWYYPFNYTPFASDLYGMDKVNIEFELSQPFQPVAQLLAVLPPYSAKAVPPCFRPLMVEEDSEIVDFYPRDFYVDIKGKRFAWMGEVILPFIDEDRLLRAIEKHADKMSQSEVRRNRLGETIIYARQDNMIMNALSQQVGSQEFFNPGAKTYIDFNKGYMGGTFIGRVPRFELNKDYRKPLPGDIVSDITENKVVSLVYENPSYKQHQSKLLPGCILPDRMVSDEVYEQIDRRTYAGQRTIRLIERTLGLQGGDYNDRGRSGHLNQIQTHFGSYQHQARLSNYNTDFNSNRAVERGPDQFKRFSQQELVNFRIQQHAPQMNPPMNQGGILNQMGPPPVNPMGMPMPMPMGMPGPMMNPGMNGSGGAFFNPPQQFNNQHQQQQYQQHQQYHPQQQIQQQNQQYQSQYQEQQQQGVDPNKQLPADPNNTNLDKRDRPYGSRSPDERYGDQVNKRQFQ